MIQLFTTQNQGFHLLSSVSTLVPSRVVERMGVVELVVLAWSVELDCGMHL
jgi:hypothetical protein